MVMGFCPRCKQTFSYNEYDVDYVHRCNSGKETLDQEDILVVDTPNAMRQGLANIAEMTAKIKGERSTTTNVFGHTKVTHETRQHYEYIVLK